MSIDFFERNESKLRSLFVFCVIGLFVISEIVIVFDSFNSFREYSGALLLFPIIIFLAGLFLLSLLFNEESLPKTRLFCIASIVLVFVLFIEDLFLSSGLDVDIFIYFGVLTFYFGFLFLFLKKQESKIITLVLFCYSLVSLIVSLLSLWVFVPVFLRQFFVFGLLVFGWLVICSPLIFLSFRRPFSERILFYFKRRKNYE